MIRKTTKAILERIGEKWKTFDNILGRKANWIWHILRRNYLLHDTVDGHMTRVNGVGRTHLLGDLRNRKNILEAKGGSWRSKRWKRQFTTWKQGRNSSSSTSPKAC